MSEQRPSGGKRHVEAEFLRRLKGIGEFETAGFSAQALPHSGIAIMRSGLLRGVWCEHDWTMRWQSMEQVDEPLDFETIDAALCFAMRLVLSTLKVRRRQSLVRAAAA